MRGWTIYILFITTWLGTGMAAAQDGPPPLDFNPNYRLKPVFSPYGTIEVENGDTTYVFTLPPIYVFDKITGIRGNERLIRNLKIVYPIARYANRKLREMERMLATMEGDRRAQERYTKQIEKELKEQYTPIIRRMSFSQGKILIKLIDRETGQTTYDLVRELRGGFSAFFWQNLGRLFGMNLKSTYDAAGEDRQLERLIILFEAGLI